MQVCFVTTVWFIADLGVASKNVVKLFATWQPSQATPATGMWVDVLGVVAAAPLSKGMTVGW